MSQNQINNLKAIILYKVLKFLVEKLKLHNHRSKQNKGITTTGKVTVCGGVQHTQHPSRHTASEVTGHLPPCHSSMHQNLYFQLDRVHGFSYFFHVRHI